MTESDPPGGFGDEPDPAPDLSYEGCHTHVSYVRPNESHIWGPGGYHDLLNQYGKHLLRERRKQG